MLARWVSWTGALALVAASWSGAAHAETDIKKAVPADVHLAVYATKNSERDYQWDYLVDAWETAREERIGRRVIDLFGSRMPADKKEEVKSVWNEFKEAIEPFNCKAIVEAEEVVIAQRMEGPFNHNLVLLRLTEEEAANFVKGMTNVFELMAEKGHEKLSVKNSKVGDVGVTSLDISGDCPMTPSVAQVEDVVVLCSHPELMRRALEQLSGSSAESKFDDPRLKKALEHLPEPEDALVFFDGQQLSESLAGIGDFIRDKKPDDDDAKRAARVLESIVEHLSILDYEVTVEYTEEGQNRQTALGKLADDAGQKVLGRALTKQQPFKEWKSWIPAEATSYSLWTGMDLHVIYEGVMALVEDEFPESERGLEKFERAQDRIGVHLDQDILRNISGECVCVTLPVGEGASGKPHTVLALKVEDGDVIRGLITRGVEALGRIPAVQTQQLAIVESELEGFQQINAALFGAVGVKPVYGVRDGWLIISSHADAAKKVIDVRAGEADSIADAESFKQFDVDVDGDVYLVKYQDLGAGIRQAADVVEQIGTYATVFGSAALANAKPEDAKTIQQALGLLPSIAKVIRKFDYLESQLSVVREGPEDGMYLRDTITKIRQPSDQ